MKLTRKERSAMFQARNGLGEWPDLHRPGGQPCPVEKGTTIVLSKRLSIEITNIRRARKGHHVIVYVPSFPERELYLLPCSHKVPVDDDGNLVPVSIAEEHGYTTDPGRGLSGSRDAGAVVSLDFQVRLNLEARVRHGMNRGRQISAA